MCCRLKKGCCCCLSLRAGCIIIALIEIVIACIATGMYFNWASIIGLVLNILAAGCLLFAAVAVNSSINLRGIGILIHVGFNILYTILISISAIFLCITWASGGDAWTDEEHAILAALTIFYFLWIFCYVYFIMVAISYYRELKEGNSSNGANVWQQSW